MVDVASLAFGLLGGAAIAGFAGWTISYWLRGRSGSNDPQSLQWQSQQFSATAQQMLNMQAQQFASFAQQALNQSADQFIRLARSELEGQFGRERQALSGTVGPLKESLTQIQGLFRAIEEDRNKAYGNLDSELKNLKGATASLLHETVTLSTALRNPQARGRWGEVALRRLVELAGMTEHCDFETQVSLSNMEDRLRPDMVVSLPSGRVIPVDSKVSVTAYLDALDAKSAEDRDALMRKHADQVRSRLRDLSNKEYAEGVRELGEPPEFRVMFIPGDDFLAAALSADPGLFDEAADKKVMLASPTILLPLLRVVEAGWRQERFLKSIEQLREEARTLYDRLAGLTDHLGRMGKKLEGTVDEYNAFVGSFDRRVIPQARKFEEMGVQGSKTLPAVEPVETRPHQPKSAES